MAVPTDPKTIEVANQAKTADFDPKDSEFDPVLDSIEPLQPQAKPAAKPTEQPVSPAKHQHSRSAVRRALKLGATQAQISATDPDTLEDWIDDQSEAQARLREEAAEARAIERYHRAQAAPVQQPKQEEDELALDDEFLNSIDPKAAKLLKKIPEILKQNREFAQDRERRAQTDVSEAVDEALEEIARTDLYGEGDITSIADGTAERKRRMALFSAAGITKDDSPSVVRRKVKATHKLLYGASPKAPEAEPEAPTYGGEPASAGQSDLAPHTAPLVPKSNGKPRITPDQWAAATTQPPTSRGKKQPKSKERAYAEVAKQMRENGLTDDDYAFEEEGLPD